MPNPTMTAAPTSPATAPEPGLPPSVRRVRLVGMVEGISFLALLGIAMPLKYLADMPLAVRYVGMAHGLLFLAYVAVLIEAHVDRGWSFKRSALLFAASVVPFGPFIADRSLRSEGVPTSAPPVDRAT